MNKLSCWRWWFEVHKLSCDVTVMFCHHTANLYIDYCQQSVSCGTSCLKHHHHSIFGQLEVTDSYTETSLYSAYYFMFPPLKLISVRLCQVQAAQWWTLPFWSACNCGWRVTPFSRCHPVVAGVWCRSAGVIQLWLACDAVQNGVTQLWLACDAVQPVLSSCGWRLMPFSRCHPVVAGVWCRSAGVT